jgi:hypothetical protein
MDSLMVSCYMQYRHVLYNKLRTDNANPKEVLRLFQVRPSLVNVCSFFFRIQSYDRELKQQRCRLQALATPHVTIFFYLKKPL